MKFFIPKAETPQDEQEIYTALKKGVEGWAQATVSGRKVHSISYRHNGKDRFATVGEIDPIQNELVLAVFFEPGRRVYHVCTPNRGLFAGPAILVGSEEIHEIVDFD